MKLVRYTEEGKWHIYNYEGSDMSDLSHINCDDMDMEAIKEHTRLYKLKVSEEVRKEFDKLEYEFLFGEKPTISNG